MLADNQCLTVRINPKTNAVISLLSTLTVALVIGIAIFLTQPGQTLLFWISGICSGYAIRISIVKLRTKGLRLPQSPLTKHRQQYQPTTTTRAGRIYQ